MSSTPTFAHAIRHVLAEALDRDARVVVLGETVGRLGGVGGSTEGLARAHPERVRDLPIADRGTVGLAVGMAIGGQRPVVCLESSSRLASVLAPLADGSAIADRGEFGVPLVVRVPVGDEGPPLDQPTGALLADVPGLRVVSPADAGMAAGLLRWALAQSHPTVILEPRSRYGHRAPMGGDAVEPRARLLRTGHHVTLAAWGAGVATASQAAEALARDGIEADVLDLVSLAPLDAEVLGERVRATGRLVAVHGGDAAWGERVRQQGTDAAFLYLEAPIGMAPAHHQPVIDAARAAVTY